jgi:hypothetical protein
VTGKNPKTQPRWEWRIFSDDLASQEERIRRYSCQRLKISEEIYLLSRHSPHNCKIRDGLLDIKKLVKRNDHQLELWRPVLKAGFPLDADLMHVLCKVLKVNLVNELECYQLEDLLANLIKPNPDLTAVRVEKERHGFEIDGVSVEIAILKINDQHLHTIGAEHQEPQKVVELVERLGFTSFQNQNYIQALKNFMRWQ